MYNTVARQLFSTPSEFIQANTVNQRGFHSNVVFGCDESSIFHKHTFKLFKVWQ